MKNNLKDALDKMLDMSECYSYSGNHMEDDKDLYLSAAEALKKQIQQEVQNIYPGKKDESGISILMGDCPICGSSVPAERWYCWSCGQRLGWEN